MSRAKLRTMSRSELADFALIHGLSGGVAAEIAGIFLSDYSTRTNGPRNFRDYFHSKENPHHAKS